MDEPPSAAPNTSGDPATLQGVFVFAQLSTSVSDDQIRLIIIALLVVAVLLAALTTWYFVKTSPTRRVRAAQARRQAAGPNRAATSGAAAGAVAGTARPTAEHSTAQTAQPSASAMGAEDDDEWDRLTAPEPRRPASN